MAYDKVVDSAQLDADLASVASKIKEKAGVTEGIAWPQGFLDALSGISGGEIELFDQVVTGTYIPTDDNKSELPVPSNINAEDVTLFAIWVSEPSVEYSPYTTLTQGVWFKFVDYEGRSNNGYQYLSDSDGGQRNTYPYLSVDTNRVTFGTTSYYLRVGVEYTYMFCTGKRGTILADE